MKIHALRLHPGDDLKASIENYVVNNNIKAGTILTCVGSLNTATLRMVNQKVAKVFDQKFEIVSLVGTLAVEGCHLHISLSDKNGAVIGGHLKEGCLIFTTAEIVLGEIESHIFGREHDNATGFKELAIRKKDN